MIQSSQQRKFMIHPGEDVLHNTVEILIPNEHAGCITRFHHTFRLPDWIASDMAIVDSTVHTYDRVRGFRQIFANSNKSLDRTFSKIV